MTEGYYRIHTLALGPVALFKTSTGHLERMDMKRINHNNLLPWFTMDHSQLPDAYLKSCRKFFKEISDKRQAASNKQQAPGVTVTRSNLFTEALKLDTTKDRKDNYENK
jgi:hypothetical protein